MTDNNPNSLDGIAFGDDVNRVESLYDSAPTLEYPSQTSLLCQETASFWHAVRTIRRLQSLPATQLSDKRIAEAVDDIEVIALYTQSARLRTQIEEFSADFRLRRLQSTCAECNSAKLLA